MPAQTFLRSTTPRPAYFSRPSQALLSSLCNLGDGTREGMLTVSLQLLVRFRRRWNMTSFDHPSRSRCLTLSARSVL